LILPSLEKSINSISSYVGSTATFLNNLWTDSWGTSFSFLKGHSFTSFSIFNSVFGPGKPVFGRKPTPEHPKVPRLQKVLQAFAFARPNDVLSLPGLVIVKEMFELSPSERNVCRGLWLEYQIKQSNNEGGFGSLVRALQASIHPRLHESRAESPNDLEDDDDPENVEDGFKNLSNAHVSDRWIKEMEKTQVVDSSSRMKSFWTRYRKDEQYEQEMHTFVHVFVLIFEQGTPRGEEHHLFFLYCRTRPCSHFTQAARGQKGSSF
jgi:hypothetical protein